MLKKIVALIIVLFTVLQPLSVSVFAEIGNDDSINQYDEVSYKR